MLALSLISSVTPTTRFISLLVYNLLFSAPAFSIPIRPSQLVLRNRTRAGRCWPQEAKVRMWRAGEKGLVSGLYLVLTSVISHLMQCKAHLDTSQSPPPPPGFWIRAPFSFNTHSDSPSSTSGISYPLSWIHPLDTRALSLRIWQ